MLITTIAKVCLKFKNPPSVAGLPATISSSPSLPCQVASSLYICSGAPLGFYATVIINPMQSKSPLLPLQVVIIVSDIPRSLSSPCYSFSSTLRSMSTI